MQKKQKLNSGKKTKQIKFNNVHKINLRYKIKSNSQNKNKIKYVHIKK
jgi:hypothetical protein